MVPRCVGRGILVSSPILAPLLEVFHPFFSPRRSSIPWRIVRFVLCRSFSIFCLLCAPPLVRDVGRVALFSSPSPPLENSRRLVRCFASFCSRALCICLPRQPRLLATTVVSARLWEVSLFSEPSSKLFGPVKSSSCRPVLSVSGPLSAF